VTEWPGFVDMAMMKTKSPLPPLVLRLLVCDASTAARHMLRAIFRNPAEASATSWVLSEFSQICNSVAKTRALKYH
jgi:hypothetical protein